MLMHDLFFVLLLFIALIFQLVFLAVGLSFSKVDIFVVFFTFFHYFQLDHAMDLARYRIRSAKSFVWWYILPLAIPTLGNMLTGNKKEWWQWVLIIGAFVLSYSLIRWELVKRYTPGLRKLEKIKSQIAEA